MLYVHMFYVSLAFLCITSIINFKLDYIMGLLALAAHAADCIIEMCHFANLIRFFDANKYEK